jgi:pyruvate formate lyase activating enzyme
MKILGLQKLTLLDYPGKIACTVFLGGCNFRCPFCHNGDLVLADGKNSLMTVEELLAFLDSRRGRLQGVCVSGGEPTVHPDLPILLSEIKARGFDVKLDTNGTNPQMLLALINDRLVDYVAMDIKNSPEKYFLTTGLNAKCRMENAKLLLSRVKQSAAILMEGRVDFEFRTTLVRELHDEGDIESIGLWLSGNEKFYLQTCRDEGELLVGGFTAFTPKETEELLAILKSYIPSAEIR